MVIVFFARWPLFFFNFLHYTKEQMRASAKGFIKGVIRKNAKNIKKEMHEKKVKDEKAKSQRTK